MGNDGVSPEDSERLLLRPVETALKSIQGVKQMTSTACQGGGNVLPQFQAGAKLNKALTAIFGVLPVAFGLNLELRNHETTPGAPSTQWWISLSGAIVFGLAFATILTLIVTPPLLMLVSRRDVHKPRRRAWFVRRRAAVL
jgi:multidrug efflux pump subunit AcrB